MCHVLGVVADGMPCDVFSFMVAFSTLLTFMAVHRDILAVQPLLSYLCCV